MSSYDTNRSAFSTSRFASVRGAALRVVVVFMGVAALLGSGVPVGATTGPGTHTTFNCALRSRANGLFVSAELGDASYLQDMLRARATTVGPWEGFVCHAIGSSSWGIQSRASGHYVSAELGYPGVVYGMLRARATSFGPWEQYSFVPVGSCSCYAIRAANGLYVSAELGDPGLLTGMLRARARVIGPWEKFDVVGPPTVTGVDQGMGWGNVLSPGFTVTISGTGFSTEPGATTFDFGGANPATHVVCLSTTRCTMTTPPPTVSESYGGVFDVIAAVDGLVSSPNPPYDVAGYLDIGPCCGF